MSLSFYYYVQGKETYTHNPHSSLYKTYK